MWTAITLRWERGSVGLTVASTYGRSCSAPATCQDAKIQAAAARALIFPEKPEAHVRVCVFKSPQLVCIFYSCWSAQKSGTQETQRCQCLTFAPRNLASHGSVYLNLLTPTLQTWFTHRKWARHEWLNEDSGFFGLSYWHMIAVQ